MENETLKKKQKTVITTAGKTKKCINEVQHKVLRKQRRAKSDWEEEGWQ